MDEPARRRAEDLYRATVHELERVISDDLRDELDRLIRPLNDHADLSGSDLQIAEAQLLGWIDGLIQNLHANVVRIEVRETEPR